MTRFRRVCLIAGLLAAVTGTASAQTSVHCYITTTQRPVVGQFGAGPKYIRALGTGYSTVVMGNQPTTLACTPVTDAQDQSLFSHLDVISIPTPLDEPVSAAGLAKLQTALDGIKVPSAWIKVNVTTNRDVIGFIARVFLYTQRLDTVRATVSFFDSGASLQDVAGGPDWETQWFMQYTAELFGLDDPNFHQDETIDQFLTRVAPQAIGPLVLQGEAF